MPKKQVAIEEDLPTGDLGEEESDLGLGDSDLGGW